MIIGDRTEWYFGSGHGWHSSEAWIAFVPPVSVKDRPLHWVLDRSQTYYPEHILRYGHREDLLLSCHGFWLFPDRLLGWFLGEGPSIALSPGLRSGGLESKFEREPGPHDRRVVDWPCLCLRYKRGVCFRVPSWAQ